MSNNISDELLNNEEAEVEKLPFAKVRYAICLECDQITKIRRCSQCNCFMPFKVRLSGAECPLGKWSKE
jgi:hypothetical protein